MCDVSDGLVVDAGSLASASSREDGTALVLILDLDAVLGLVLASPAADAWRAASALDGADPGGWLLGGGEDHALLATVPPYAVGAARALGAVPVGRVRTARADEAATVTDLEGAPLAGGWDHFAARPVG